MNGTLLQKRHFFYLGCIAGIGLILLPACGNIDTGIKSEFIMGTTVSIRVPRDEFRNKLERNVTAETVFEESFDAVRQVDAALSSWRKTSEISRLNDQPAGKKIKIRVSFLEVLEKSVYISQVTAGAFDITMGPLLKLWGFGPHASGKPGVPSDGQIEKALEQTGWRNLIIDRDSQEAGLGLSGMSIDLGGIAKGYAVDKAVEVLRHSGISRALVEAGGDIYCLGSGLNGNGWRVGLQHPRQREKHLMVLTLTDKAVATSGDYENYFIRNNKRYSHIIDPRPGHTVQETPMSVSIIADDCATADAMATAVFVMGPEEGMRFVESQERIEAVIVSGDKDRMRIDVSGGVDKYEAPRL